jgi:phosphatidate cytidylyltransferase
MLLQRVLVTLILLPIGLVFIFWGGVPFAALVALIIGLAAWEYAKLFRAGGLQPAGFVVIGGAILLAGGRAWNGFDSAPWMISLLILGAMTWHLLAFERGHNQAGTDFGVTLGGVFYIGWIGAYLISLRQLPEGQWWLLTALPACWLADSGAYLVGSRIGRHKMTPRLSPKKSWEGYIAGIAFAVLGTPLLVLLWGVWTGPASAVAPARGAILGLLMGVLTILGDLGESMIKRQVGVKDSSNLLPGHGGAFDRIDSWLWAGVIGYYTILWLFL